MIALGLDNGAKDAAVSRYCAEHGIAKVFVLSPEKMRIACSFPNHEHVEYSEIIMYKFFYRLLREIGKDTLVVVNECLRTQDRYDLTYNCIRNFLNQTTHQIVFQYLPIIDTADDFAILFDFDTRSRWKRTPFAELPFAESGISVRPAAPSFRAIHIETDARTRAAYANEKRKLIDGLGLRDPHTIPRNLHLMSGKAKLKHVNTDRQYVGRNNRFSLSNMRTYRDSEYPAESTLFEFCHNSIDFADFLTLSRQTSVDTLVSDLKVDRWYFDRCQSWAGRVRNAYAAIQR